MTCAPGRRARRRQQDRQAATSLGTEPTSRASSRRRRRSARQELVAAMTGSMGRCDHPAPSSCQCQVDPAHRLASQPWTVPGQAHRSGEDRGASAGHRLITLADARRRVLRCGPWVHQHSSLGTRIRRGEALVTAKDLHRMQRLGTLFQSDVVAAVPRGLVRRRHPDGEGPSRRGPLFPPRRVLDWAQRQGSARPRAALRPERGP